MNEIIFTGIRKILNVADVKSEYVYCPTVLSPQSEYLKVYSRGRCFVTGTRRGFTENNAVLITNEYTLNHSQLVLIFILCHNYSPCYFKVCVLLHEYN
jgi:hypothetical protein